MLSISTEMTDTLSPIDKLTDPNECLKLLKEMKPKNLTYIESIDKVEGILRLYEKTIDVLECAKIDAESTGNRVAYDMTLDDIENALSEQLTEKMLLEEAILLEAGKIHATINEPKSVSSNKAEYKTFVEVICRHCKTVNNANIYNRESDCFKCNRLLFDDKLTYTSRTMNMDEDSDEDGWYKQISCQHCGTKNNANIYKPESKCSNCQGLLFGDKPSGPHADKPGLTTFMEVECKKCKNRTNINIYDRQSKCARCDFILFGELQNDSEISKKYEVTEENDWSVKITCQHCNTNNHINTPDATCSKCNRELFFKQKSQHDITCSYCHRIYHVKDLNKYLECNNCGCILIKGKSEEIQGKDKEKVDEKNKMTDTESQFKFCHFCESVNDIVNVMCCVCNKPFDESDSQIDIKELTKEQWTFDNFEISKALVIPESTSIPKIIIDSNINFLKEEAITMTCQQLDFRASDKSDFMKLVADDRKWTNIHDCYQHLTNGQKHYIYCYLEWFAHLHGCIVAKEMYVHNVANATVYGLKLNKELACYEPGTYWLQVADDQFEKRVNSRMIGDTIYVVGSNDEIVLSIKVEHDRLLAEGSMNFYSCKRPILPKNNVPSYIA